jgi:hypothetical protein
VKAEPQICSAVSINQRVKGARNVRRESGGNCFCPCSQNRLVLMVISSRSTPQFPLKFINNTESRRVYQNDNNLSVVNRQFCNRVICEWRLTGSRNCSAQHSSHMQRFYPTLLSDHRYCTTNKPYTATTVQAIQRQCESEYPRVYEIPCECEVA